MNEIDRLIAQASLVRKIDMTGSQSLSVARQQRDGLMAQSPFREAFGYWQWREAEKARIAAQPWNLPYRPEHEREYGS